MERTAYSFAAFLSHLAISRVVTVASCKKLKYNFGYFPISLAA